MTRKKVKLAWIANDSARKASLKKRRASLLKKVRELSTLCGVRACIIIYSPDDVDPATWPVAAQEVQQMLLRFRSMPELERSKKMMDQEGYIKDRVVRVQGHLRKQQRRNKEVEMNQIMELLFNGGSIEGFNMRELDGVLWWVEEKKKELRKRMQFFQQVPPPAPTMAAPAILPTLAPVPVPLQVVPNQLPPPPPMMGAPMVPSPMPAYVVQGATEMGHLPHFPEGMATAAMPMALAGNMEQLMWDEWLAEMIIPNDNMGNMGGAVQGNVGNDGVLPPQGNVAGASSSNVANNDVGLPYEIYRSWPNIFSP